MVPANRRTKKTDNTVFFRYSPSDSSITRKNFETYFSEIGPVKKCSLIRTDKKKDDEEQSSNRDAKGFGFCKFTSQEDAAEAANKLNNSKMQLEYGMKVKVWVEVANKQGQDTASSNSNSSHKKKRIEATAAPSTTDTSKSTLPDGTPSTNDNALSTEELLLQAKKRTSRVILRNLSFYATENNIRQIMQEQFGEIVEINLPLVPTMDNGNDNEEAGAGYKRKKQRQQHRGFAFVTFANQNSAQKAVEACASADGQVLIKKRPVAIDFSMSKFQHRRMMEEQKEGKNNDDGDESSSSSSGNEDGSSSSGDDSDGSDDDSSSSDEDEDVTESDDSDTQMDDTEAKTKEDSHNHSLFLRNLPFDTTRHDIFTLFAQYGRIGGIYIVKDQNTGLAKGTAFVKFEKEGGCVRALEASYTGAGEGASENTDGFQNGKSMMTSLYGNGGGLYLRGRRILVDKAVDKNTAESLKVQRDEDGKPIDKKIGKDKRNLYLKGEGRVKEAGKESTDPNCWENIPQGDQLKRGRAHQEKHTKLRSPLFFINPYRLSLRNLAKHIDESQLKAMVGTGIKNGLENDLVSKEDVVAYWRAGGELTAREIIEKLKASEDSDGDDIIPSYDESDGFKKYIPSVFIDRDFQSKDGKVSKNTAPSKGFGFVEFTHHAHALACLRELNNNVAYAAEFVAGGKKATVMKKHMSNRKKKKTNAEADIDEEFLGEDGRVRVPRLIVEFTVENKAKARKQAERKAQQHDNAQKQKAIIKQSLIDENGEKKEKKKKKSRGAQQRAKKRKMREEGSKDKSQDSDKKVEKKQKINKEDSKEKEVTKKQKGIKPPKKMKIDKDENAFEDMVRSYKKAFEGSSKSNESKSEEKNERDEITSNRWFD